MKLDDCRVDGSKRFVLAKYPTSAKIDKSLKKEYLKKMAANTQLIAELQEKLYAEKREGVIIAIQAMDAGGKDSAIKHVLTGVNPQGVSVANFKAPTKTELAHDYLWRVVQSLPERGMIGIFNRSHYEDVMVVRAKNMRGGYAMPDRFFKGSDKAFFDARYRQIREFEAHLYENGYRMIKIFLNLSMEEQTKRMISRIDEPKKNWKFSLGDLDNRPLWNEFAQAHEKAIAATSTPEAPWYVIPADQKWFARWLISEAIVKVLKDCKPQFPTVSEEDLAVMLEAREKLITGQI